MTILSTTQPSGQRYTIDTTNAGPLDISLEPEGSGGAVPPPTPGVDDGAVVLAGSGGSAGLLTYFKGTIVKQFLQWNGTRWLAALANYQTVQNAAAPLPQEPALNILNGTLADNPGNGSTDLTLWNQILTVSDSSPFQEPIIDFDAAGFTLTDVPGVKTSVGNKAVAKAILAQTQFKATFYVDPTFAGSPTGAACCPFPTIAGAFAAAGFQGLTSAIIIIPPGSTITENVVFPSTGGNWVIMSQGPWGLFAPALINGTVTVDCTVFSRFALVNLEVAGPIAGDSSLTPFFSRLLLSNVQAASTLTLTASGGGNWRVFCDGGASNVNSEGGLCTGAVAVVGSINTSAWSFIASVAWTLSPTFAGTSFASNTLTNTSGANTATFYDCTYAANTTISAPAGSCVAALDGASMANAVASGLILGTATTLKTVNANASSTTTEANNRGSTALGARAPTGLYELVFSATLLVAGTTGLLQVNVIYTDMTGTLVTVAVGGTLNITAAVGTKQAGSLPFQHNGAAAAIAFSTTGIVTPGAMSVALAVAVRRVN